MSKWVSEDASAVKVGDVVQRTIMGMGGQPKPFMKLRVTEVTDDKIVCGLWEFDKAGGAEIDEDLGWGPKHGVTGTFLTGVIDEKPDFDVDAKGEYSSTKAA